jgi:DNA-binding beta-propeller fold protein YncE/cytochrome c
MRHCLALILLIIPVTLLQAGSSNSLMDVSPDGQRLAVANTDNGTVSILSLKDRKKLHEFAVGDHPEGVSWIGKSPRVLVTVYGDDKVLIYNTDTKKLEQTIAVEDEPYGVVTTKDGRRAYVTLEYPGKVCEIDTETGKVLRSFKVGDGLRGLAISPDEKTLYVTEFFTANLIGVDRETGQVKDRWPAFTSDNLARHVVLHPTRAKAYLSHIRSRVTAFDARGSIFPQLSFVDLDKPATEKRRRSMGLDTYNNVYVVTNPWEAALSPDGKKIYTIYAGTDDMNVSATVDDDYQEVDRIGGAYTVGKHPRAVKTSPDGAEVYVYNTLDYEVVILNENLRKLGAVKVCEPPHSADWRRGKELFQSAKSPMGSARWIACSSCHPDGLTDGRVWQNPEGHRKTPNLFGLAHTHPLHWSADRDETQDFEYTIRGKLMQGRGLAKEKLIPRKSFTEFAELQQVTSGLSKELDAMAIYTNSFPVRLSPHNPAPGKLSEEAERGKKLFFSNTTQCATCHSGPYYSDSTLTKPFKLHDVGTGDATTEKIGPKYDTPTLLGVYRMNSYLHDGRAKTLEDVLTKYNIGDKHGKTSQLKGDEIRDLVSFLKALPYETPPDETPNTVKSREKLKPITEPKGG